MLQAGTRPIETKSRIGLKQRANSADGNENRELARSGQRGAPIEPQYARALALIQFCFLDTVNTLTSTVSEQSATIKESEHNSVQVEYNLLEQKGSSLTTHPNPLGVD
jgi:hypothetical protein